MLRTLLQPAQFSKSGPQLVERVREGIEPLPGQSPTYDPVRLGLAIGNFISAIGAPSCMAVDRLDPKG